MYLFSGSNDYSCLWEITAESGGFLIVEILEFDLEYSEGCIFDSLLLYENDILVGTYVKQLKLACYCTHKIVNREKSFHLFHINGYCTGFVATLPQIPIWLTVAP